MKIPSGCVVALSMAISAAPASAGPNDPPPGASAQRAAPGDLGMAIMSAVVRADGVLARGEGVVSTANIVTGNYEVVFGRDVTACAYAPTLSGAEFSSSTGSISAMRRVSNDNGLYIETRDLAGSLANRDFHVIVYCGR